MAKKRLGRIVFPGNPWPKGHAVTAFIWTGRVDRSSGIWFDMHLQTEDYYAADRESVEIDDEEEDRLSDWEARSLWYNFHSCTISSTFWPGCGYGFLAGSKDEQLDFKKLSKRVFEFDPEPASLAMPRPFNIYLHGHDAVCDHCVVVKREPKKSTYSIDWKGKIALAYYGDETFRYEFAAKVAGVRFGGIQFPPGTHDPMSLVVPFVHDPRKWKLRKTQDLVKVMPV